MIFNRPTEYNVFVEKFSTSPVVLVERIFKINHFSNNYLEIILFRNNNKNLVLPTRIIMRWKNE